MKTESEHQSPVENNEHSSTDTACKYCRNVSKSLHAKNLMYHGLHMPGVCLKSSFCVALSNSSVSLIPP